MAKQSKPVFWLTVLIVIGGLVAFALYRANVLFKTQKPAQPVQAGQPHTTAPRADILDISFYSSSAKDKWINEMVKEFNASGIRSGEKIIRVKTVHVNSGESLDQLKEGKIKPDLWSPGDESWLEMGAAYWRDVKRKPLFDDYKPLVNIPLIVAMWEPMAKVLGHPNPIGWKDIAKVAANPQGWAALGHPEWGKFRWGHAHPDANSGFLTIISEVYAALDKTEGITPQDMKKPEVISFLREFEGAVEHYGLSNSWIDDLMHIKGPSYLSATVQYENTIIQTNEKHNNKPFKLIAIYPKEGNVWTQHPVAIIKEEWMTPEKENACRIFVDFLLSKDSQAKAMKMGLRPIIKDIELSTPFDDFHGVSLKVSDEKMFRVPDEDVLKRVRDLWEEVKMPATVVLVLDRSGSMKGAAMDNAKQGAIEFIKNMKPRDQVMVVVFNEIVTVLSDMCSIRECGEEVMNRLHGVFADGGTALHDATLQNFDMLNKIRQQNPSRRYSILLLSDGKDTRSKINRYDFLDALPKGEDYDVPKIYSIAYGNEADKALLTEVSNRTNGRVFISSPEEIAKTYRELSANF